MPTQDENTGKAYDAFLSYSHEDLEFASKLQKALNTYHPPKDPDIPQKRLKIFRDKENLTGTAYEAAIEKSLSKCRNFIVVCSSNSRNSKYVNDEITRWVKRNDPSTIIPILLSGVPNNTATADQEELKAFPKALYEDLYEKRMATPLAMSFVGFDARKSKINKGEFEEEWFKLLSVFYEVPPEKVAQLDQREQVRRRNQLLAIVSVIVLALTGLAGYAFIQKNLAEENAREARRQEQIALGNAEEAKGHQVLAEINAKRAKKQQRIAEDNEKLAFVNEKEAKRQADWAKSQSLTNNASVKGQTDPTLGALLLNEAIDLPESLEGMRTARFLMSFPLKEKIINEPSGVVTNVKFSPDSQWIATSSKNGTVRLWGVEQGEGSDPSLVFRGYEQLNDVVFSPKGKWIFAASENQGVGIYRNEGDGIVSTPFKEIKRADNRRNVRQISFSSNGKWLATTYSAGGVVVWPITFTREEENEEKDVVWGEPFHLKDAKGNQMHFGAFSHNSNLIATASGNSVRVWALGEGKINKHPLEVSIGIQSTVNKVLSVSHVAWSHDDRWLAAGGSEGKVLLVGFNDNGEIRIKKALSGNSKTVSGYSKTVKNVDFSPDDSMLATGALDGTAMVWHLYDRQGVLPDQDIFYEQESGVRVVRFTPDGSRLITISSHGRVRIWPLELGKREKTPVELNVRNVKKIAFSDDGLRMVTISDDKTVTTWRIDQIGPHGEPIILSQNASHESRISISSDGQWVLSYWWNDPLMLWKIGRDGLEGGPIELSKPPIENPDLVDMMFSPDGQWVVGSSFWKDGHIWVWKLGTSKKLGSSNLPKLLTKFAVKERDLGKTKFIAFSPDGQWLITAGEKPNQPTVWRLKKTEKSGTWQKNGYLPEHPSSVSKILFSPNGKYVSTLSQGKVGMWAIENGKANRAQLLQQNIKESYQDIGYLQDGKLYANSKNQFFRIWKFSGADSSTHTWIIHSPSKDIDRLVLSFDGSLLGTRKGEGHEYSSILVWRILDQRRMGSLILSHRLKSGFLPIHFSRNGRRLATQTSGKILIWSISSRGIIGDPVELSMRSSPIFSRGFSPDSNYLFTVSDKEGVSIWRLGWKQLLTHLRSKTSGCLTIQERLRYLPEDPSVAKAKYETCERRYGRVPVASTSF